MNGTCQRVAWSWGASMVLALASAGSANAQYQLQQDGRLFDANPMVGADGRNYARPVSPLMGGNAAASGNVRFGGALRGVSPIQDPTAFRGTLGSSTLSAFRRDSVGVGDVQLFKNLYQSGPRLMTPYYDPAGTVATGGYLLGQTTPGVTRLQRQRRTPLTTGDVSPLDMRLDARVEDGGAADARLSTAPLMSRSPLTTSLFRTPMLPSPAEADFSGLPGRERASRSMFDEGDLRWNATRAAASREDADDADDPAGERRVGTPLDLVLTDQRIESYVRHTPAPRLGESSDRGSEPTAPRLGQPGTTSGSERSTQLPVVPVDRNVLPGFDVFSDMQLALTLEEQVDSSWYDEVRETLAGQGELGEELPADGRDFAKERLTTPLGSFVGEGESRLNDALAEAERALALGHYYDAAAQFGIAQRVAPQNPLPLLGQAHALLGAGEYSSAALYLVRALQAYPEIARFPIDLRSLMGGGEVVDIRRADIMRRLEEREDVRMRFLLGYLEYHGGEPEQGLKNLERAAAAADPSTPIASYPSLLQGWPKAAPSPGREDRAEDAPLRAPRPTPQSGAGSLVIPPRLDEDVAADGADEDGE